MNIFMGNDMEEVTYIPGDLVMFNNRVMPIINIDHQTSYRVEIQMKDGYCTIEPNEIDKYIKPVPLTQLILAANNFKVLRQDESGALYFKEGLGVDIVSSFTRNCYDLCIRGEKILCNIKYCHDLQHLLFGLGLNSELNV